MSLEVARAHRRAACLDEALTAAVDDHDDASAARAARRLEHELALGGQASREMAHAPLCVADVAESRRRDAPGGERRLRRLLVVDQPVAGPWIVREQVAVVSPVEAQHLGVDAPQGRDHDRRASAGETEPVSAGPCRTARKKRTYSRSRMPRHFPRTASNATVTSRISGNASTSDWSPAWSTTR